MSKRQSTAAMILRDVSEVEPRDAPASMQAKGIKQVRADDFPLCPLCGQDTLRSDVVNETNESRRRTGNYVAPSQEAVLAGDFHCLKCPFSTVEWHEGRTEIQTIELQISPGRIVTVTFPVTGNEAGMYHLLDALDVAKRRIRAACEAHGVDYGIGENGRMM